MVPLIHGDNTEPANKLPAQKAHDRRRANFLLAVGAMN